MKYRALAILAIFGPVLAKKVSIAAAPSPVGMEFQNGAASASVTYTSGGGLELRASKCVDRSSFCGRYKRSDCVGTGAAAKKMTFTTKDKKRQHHVKLSDDGVLSFDMGGGGCVNPVASWDVVPNHGAKFNGDSDRAFITTSSAGLDLMSQAGFSVNGDSIEPRCSCDHGTAATDSCSAHEEHHCASCDAGFSLSGKTCKIVADWSCKDELAANPSAKSGDYELKVSGSPFTAFCDMATDGGGWTLFSSIESLKHSSSWPKTSAPGVTRGTFNIGYKPTNTVVRTYIGGGANSGTPAGPFGDDWYADGKSSTPVGQWQMDGCKEDWSIYAGAHTSIANRGFTGPQPNGQIRVGNNKGPGCNGIGHLYLAGTNGSTRLESVAPTDGSHGYSHSGFYYLATFGQYHGSNWVYPGHNKNGYNIGCRTANNENWSSHYRCFGFQSSVGWKRIYQFYR